VSAYTREQDERHYYEAVGWVTSMLDGQQLAAAAHRAVSDGCPEVARHLLRWADQKADIPWLVALADRDRERANVSDLLIDLVPDDEAF
jgi:hypothetical protein